MISNSIAKKATLIYCRSCKANSWAIWMNKFYCRSPSVGIVSELFMMHCAVRHREGACARVIWNCIKTNQQYQRFDQAAIKINLSTRACLHFALLIYSSCISVSELRSHGIAKIDASLILDLIITRQYCQYFCTFLIWLAAEFPAAYCVLILSSN